MSNEFFSMRGIVKQYRMGDELQTILKGIDLDIDEGEFLSVLGPSGSGKSTLMNIIGVLDRATAGSYLLDGEPVEDADDDELSAIRNRKIGFVFQTVNLIPSLNFNRGFVFVGFCRAYFYLDLLRCALADKQVVLFADVVYNRFVKVIARNTDRLCGYNITE